MPSPRRAVRDLRRTGVFISVDMEGVAGVVHPQQVLRGTAEYERSCQRMTAEVNAAVRGARRAGATRFLVNDSQGDMRNLVLEELDPAVEVISGSEKTFGMGSGLDATFEAAFFIGYHASIGAGQAIMEHTYGGRTIHGVRINGRPQSEATLNAALAGSFGVRSALITGDRTTVTEAQRDLDGIEGVIVKEALSRQAGRSLHPASAQRLIETGATGALRYLGQRPLYRPRGPFVLELDWMNTAMADSCALLPDIERASGRTVRYRTADFQSCYRMLQALLVMALPYALTYSRPG